jgi:HSP20 family protein
MNLIRRQHIYNNAWDPFREFQRFFESGYGLAPSQEVGWAPSVNISETDSSYVLKADLPDVKKEDVKVTHENGVLTLEGERRQEKREEHEKFHRVESSYGKFLRRFTLPENAAVDSIEASYKDGALTVTIPKAEVKAPKAREISVS